MNKSLQLRAIFTLVAALFLAVGVNAQTGLKSSKSKSSKTEKSSDKKSESDSDETVDSEEVEYYYSYLILEISNDKGRFLVTMDKSVFESGAKLANEQMEMAKRAATGGLAFGSEMELLNFMGLEDYELVTVTNGAENSAIKTKMYFRIKLER